MLPVENDVYSPIVARFLRIDDTTWGEQKKGYVVRYRGSLYNQDTVQAYDQLRDSLRSVGVTPLFRMEENRHAVILLPGVIQVKPTKIWGNIVFFGLTVLSVMFTGGYSSVGNLPSTINGWIQLMIAGLPFTIALLAILVSHEFGHYLAGRYHKTAVTLPFFIPFPLSLFGTMGAFIQLKEPPKNRRILLDIGIAGPLAGLIVAIPVLLLGLYLSPITQIPFQRTLMPTLEGNSVLYLLLKFIVKGQLLPHPFSYSGLTPVLYWIRYFFTGQPLPLGGMDVALNPIAWAGWAGLLVTALNLIPAGQLDGGHIMYVLLGRHTSRLLPFILGGLLLLGLVWSGWWFWAALIFFLGRFHAEPLDQITPLDPRRKALAVLGVIVFILVFMPVPLI